MKLETTRWPRSFGWMQVLECTDDAGRYVLLENRDAAGQLRERVAVRAEELDHLVDSLRRSRCRLLGAPDPRGGIEAFGKAKGRKA